MKNEVERRFIPATEIRVASDNGEKRIVGYAALFNARSQDLGGFTEIIAQGAFKDAIGKSDIRSLFNHDANYVLGRVKSGTLKVSEDERGLAMDNVPPDTQWANDLLKVMERGDVDQMSFAFRVAPDGDTWLIEGDKVTRTINKVEELYDVSVVTYPAYPDTSVAVRSLEQFKEKVEKESKPAELPDFPPTPTPEEIQADIGTRRRKITQALL